MPGDCDELFGVFRRLSYDQHDPETCEEPVVTCPSYGEAQRIKRLMFKNAPDCVIRFLGDAGGGD